MSRQFVFAVVIVLSALVSIGLRGGRAGDAPKFSPTAEEKKILTLTNAERKKQDLPALEINPLLSKIARAHSANMAKQEKMAHDLDGKTPYQRLTDAGYAYGRAGENV